MRRYVPFLLSLKYLRARQFRIGINLVLSRRPRTRLSRHPDFVLATSLKHRYRFDIHRFLSIFFSTSLFSFYFFILPAFPILS